MLEGHFNPCRMITPLAWKKTTLEAGVRLVRAWPLLAIYTEGAFRIGSEQVCHLAFTHHSAREGSAAAGASTSLLIASSDVLAAVSFIPLSSTSSSRKRLNDSEASDQ